MRKNQQKVIIKMEIQNNDGEADFGQTSKKFANDQSHNAEPQNISVMLEGMLKLHANRIELRYMEPEAFEMSKQATLLSFDTEAPGIITITRKGICSTVLVFEHGKRYICQYSAFGADFEFVTNTMNLHNSITFENGGELRLCYTLENGGMTVSTVRMSLTVTPEKI